MTLSGSTTRSALVFASHRVRIGKPLTRHSGSTTGQLLLSCMKLSGSSTGLALESYIPPNPLTDRALGVNNRSAVAILHETLGVNRWSVFCVCLHHTIHAVPSRVPLDIALGVNNWSAFRVDIIPHASGTTGNQRQQPVSFFYATVGINN